MPSAENNSAYSYQAPDRVAIVTTSYPTFPGDAAGHFVQTAAVREARQGAHVTVLAPGRGDPAPKTANPRVVWLPDHGLFGWPGALPRLAQRPSRALGALRFALEARWALHRLGPFDRVAAHWIVPSGWPITVGLRAQLEVVAHGSDVALLLGLPAALREGMVRSLLARGAKLRFVSSELQSRLCQGGLAHLRDSSVVAPCPIDVPDAMSRAAARTQLGVPQDEPVALVAGRLIPGKRADVALSALTLLPGLQVVVAGDGPLARSLADRFPSARHLGRLTRPETLCWMAAADVVVTASRDEGAPTVVREARAIGTPVVAAPAGELRAWAAADPGITVITSRPGGPQTRRVPRRSF